MKRLSLLIVILLLGITVADVHIGKDTVLHPISTQTNYIMSKNFTFSNVTVLDDGIKINGSYIKIVSSSGWLNVTINEFADALRNWTENCTVADANTSHLLYGYNSSYGYSLYIDGSFHQNLISSASGVITFTYSNGFSSHTFEIKDGIIGKASFRYTPNDPYVGDTVYFTDMSDNQDLITDRHWDFGDGATATGKFTSHVYNDDGIYSVTLTVTYSGGTTSTVTRTIRVYERTSPPPSSPPSDKDIIVIPPPMPPEYPELPHTIPQMYRLIGMDDNTTVQTAKIKIAVIDTGVLPLNYSNGIDMNIDMSDVKIYAIPKYNGYDENGHGTFVNAEIHYAIERWLPNSEQYSIRVMNKDGECTVEDLKNAFDMAVKLGVNVISLSLGGSGRVGDYLDMLVRSLARKGIIVVSAAGNYDDWGITSPGLSPSAICVGAENPMHTIDYISDDIVPDWSGRGVHGGILEMKPDCVAGGESIVGPYLHGEEVLSGTSMATPFIAGGVAYMLAENNIKVKLFDILFFWYRGLKQKLVERSIEKSCRPLANGSSYDYGHGLPNIEVASDIFSQMLIIYLILMIFVYVIIVALIVYAIKRHLYHKYL